MHFFSRRNASLALSLAAVGVLAACGDDVTVPVAPPAPVVVSITPQAVTLNPGASATLSVQISGGDPTPTLQSCTTGASGVATAAVSGSSCTVTAVASGSTTITATTSAGQSASAAVTVNQLPSALGTLTVSPATAALSVGQAVTLVPNANPAGAGVTTTFSYVSSAPGVATVSGTGVVTAVAAGTTTITVTANGTGTGFQAATRTVGVTINVSAAPPALTALNVSPASLGVATGGTGQLTASVAQPAGATPATITFASSNTSVATVTGSGANATVVGVTPGTATITVTATAAATSTLSAATLTQLVPVTVSARANVTIANLRQGPISTEYATVGEGLVTSANAQINQPVDIANVKDQIQVQVTLQPNGQRVDSLVIFVGDGNDQNRVSAARQVFTDGAANASTIELSVNTAEFTADFAAGTANILFPNGLRTISASVFTTLPDGTKQEIQNASNNRQTVNFNNLDSWAIRFETPTRVAQGGQLSNPNFNWRGGPDAEGQGRYTVVPVFYTPGRSVRVAQTYLGQKADDTPNALVNTLGAGCTGLSANALFTTGTDALPWTTEYGKTLTTGKRLSCNGYEHPAVNARNLPAITNTVDNFNITGPNVTIANGFRTAVQNNVNQPVAQRFDWGNPTGSSLLRTQVTGADTLWVNAVYNFNTVSVSSTLTHAAGRAFAFADGGVGLPTTLGTTFAFAGCPLSPAVATAPRTPMTANSGSEIPECLTDFTGGTGALGPYVVDATQADVLGNPVTITSPRFGVDKTAPLVQFAVATPVDSTVITAPFAAGTVLQAETLDERSGLNDATAPQHFLAIANQASPTGSCLVSAAAPNNVPGAQFVTNAACGFTNTAAGPLGIANPGTGYRPFAAITDVTLATEGYYTYSARAVDRAGNISAPARRRFLLSTTVPTLAGIGLPGQITAAGPNPFTPNFAETVEAWYTNFRVMYAGLPAPAGVPAGGGARVVYPASLYNARFNDVIGLNGNTTISTPFMSGTQFYTNFEHVDGAGNPVAGAATVNTFRPDSVGARVYNVGGFVSVNTGGPLMADILDPNVANDATRWVTKVPTLTVWSLGGSDAAWNAPATGLKAIALSNSNAQNSPFERVDFYESDGVESWHYLGSVSGTQAPAPANSASGSLYLADNGTTRVWTYRLTQAVLDSATIEGTGAALGSVAGRQFIAVGTRGSAGRSLSTLPLAAASTYPAAAAPAGLATSVLAPAAGPIVVSVAGGPFNFTGTSTFSVPGAAATVSYTCTSSNPAVATVTCGAPAAGNLTASTVTGVAPGTATITVTAATPNGIGFTFSQISNQYTVTVNP
jgi:uncharacterized protein YjdB